MTPHAEWFETGSYRRLDPPRRVRLGNDSFCDAVGTGIVRLSCKTKRGPCDVALARSLHVPTFGITLVSVHRLAKKGYDSLFHGDECVVRGQDRHRVMEAVHQNGLYHIACTPL
ncbi:hypothetical protein PENSPDRAFT_541880, partial [Peniophora sp. CONT]